MNGLNITIKILSKCIMNQDPIKCYLQKTQFKWNIMDKRKQNGKRQAMQTLIRGKKYATVVILMSNKVSSKIKDFTRYKEGYFTMMKSQFI